MTYAIARRNTVTFYAREPYYHRHPRYIESMYAALGQRYQGPQQQWFLTWLS